MGKEGVGEPASNAHAPDTDALGGGSSDRGGGAVVYCATNT